MGGWWCSSYADLPVLEVAAPADQDPRQASDLINNRALTIYLWHTLLLSVCYAIIRRLYNNDRIAEAIPWLLESEWTLIAGIWLLLTIVFLTIGWVEDVAAKRTPQLWPYR